MSFVYRKESSQQESQSQWTSYSDLFMSLSIIFLLLYVTASLRQGTTAIQKNIQVQKLAQENDDLKAQLRVYDTLKDDYAQTGASDAENRVYQDLMSKLNLLSDQAESQKEDFKKKYMEQQQKEDALNQYQKLIKNIISSNMISQARLKKRDLIIEQKQDQLTQNQTQIHRLQASISEKKMLIAQGERTITDIRNQLDDKMHQLQDSFAKQEITESNFELEKERLKKQSEEQISALEGRNTEMESQLADVSSKLVQVDTQLESARDTVSKQKNQLENIDNQYAAQINELKKQYDAQRALDQQNFEKELRKHKMSAAARAAREAQFRAEAEQKAQALNGQINSLNQKMQDTQAQLAIAKAQADARRSIAREIKKSFEAGGVKADVDEGTGDVTLNFGDQYFDTGSADLKDGMKRIIEKAVPLYSQSLFENPKVSKKITSVEIIGFASPTYKGKYIDPSSLTQGDRRAVDYNLDLSYARARSIFQYIFNTDKMTFRHQKNLLPLVKVTGRSFLAAPNSRTSASSTDVDFCGAHDCKKAQKVIIKFNLEE